MKLRIVSCIMLCLAMMCGITGAFYSSAGTGDAVRVNKYPVYIGDEVITTINLGGVNEVLSGYSGYIEYDSSLFDVKEVVSEYGNTVCNTDVKGKVKFVNIDSLEGMDVSESKEILKVVLTLRNNNKRSTDIGYKFDEIYSYDKETKIDTLIKDYNKLKMTSMKIDFKSNHETKKPESDKGNANKPSKTYKPNKTKGPQSDDKEAVDDLVDKTSKPTDDENDSVTETPADKTKEPAVKTETPTDKTKEPAVKTETPANKTKEPAVKTETPTDKTKEPVVETETPADKTKEPVVETETPADKTKEPVVETETPAVKTKEPAIKTEKPVDKTSKPQIDNSDSNTNDNKDSVPSVNTKKPAVTSKPQNNDVTPTSKPKGDGGKSDSSSSSSGKDKSDSSSSSSDRIDTSDIFDDESWDDLSEIPSITIDDEGDVLSDEIGISGMDSTADTSDGSDFKSTILLGLASLLGCGGVGGLVLSTKKPSYYY